MAKSLGNFFTLRDLLERGHDPLAIRYLLISVPYRQKLNFTFDGLHAAAAGVERIANTLRRLAQAPPAAETGALTPGGVDEFMEEFDAGLADDLNTARALAAVHTLLTRVNQALDGGGIDADTRSRLGVAFARVDAVLGIVPKPARMGGDSEIDALVAERDAARASRDFARADTIRKALTDRGVVLEDTPHGTVWHRAR